jgi:AcrR family transcriptional regulator
MYGAVGRALATVKTVMYGGMSQGTSMTDQLSAQDWLKQGLRTLAKEGFTALKAEPLAKVMGVSRGSFYWHFADIGAFHAAILKRWREVAAEQIIADLEAAPDQALPLLLRRAFSDNLALEHGVRAWAALDPLARSAVHAIDRRRLEYLERLLGSAGLSPAVARARAQILYWAFIGFALSDKPMSRTRQQEVLDELLRMALQ